MINVGFIGAGNMGYAIMKGIAGSKMGKDIQLYAFDKYAPILDRLDELGAVKCSDCAFGSHPIAIFILFSSSLLLDQFY